MRAAAVKRMKARPTSPPPKRPTLPPIRDELDRRRIPLDGLRKTQAWHAYQAFLEVCRRIEEDRERYVERTRYSNSSYYSTGTTANAPYIIIYL